MAVNRSGGNRPVSRERHTSSGGGKRVERRGGGLNLGGPVGNSGGYEDRPGTGGRSRGGGGILWLVILVAILCYVGFSDGISITGIFERILHTAREQTENVDTDDLMERFSGAAQSVARQFGLAEGEETNVRTLVDQFSGLVSGEGGVVESLSRSYTEGTGPGGAISGSRFVWSKNSRNQDVLILSDEEWNLIDTVKLNVFVDDGGGFVDLGLDPLFDFDDEGNLIGSYDGTWLAIDRQPVAFYHLITIESGDQYRIIGYVPAFLNDQHINLILAFDNAQPNGYIAGAKLIERGPGSDLTPEEMTSGLIDVRPGDRLDFVCDYYDYNGVFINNYFFGEPMTLSRNPEISNVSVPGALSATYRLEDIYGNHYWTPLVR